MHAYNAANMGDQDQDAAEYQSQNQRISELQAPSEGNLLALWPKGSLAWTVAQFDPFLFWRNPDVCL